MPSPPQSPRLKLLPALARVRVWPLEGDHSLGSVEVTRNWLLTPEQGEITSESPMDDLIDFIPSGWRRDLIHMVGCFYTSQITPLNSREWDNDQDKFIQIMDERKDSEWLDIKELMPLRYMPYVARCFQETTGHHLQGLGLHTRWIRARSYYHWKVAELDQLQHALIFKGYLSLWDPWSVLVSSNNHRGPIDLGLWPLAPLGIVGWEVEQPQGARVNHL